jgi:hypothetical protein
MLPLLENRLKELPPLSAPQFRDFAETLKYVDLGFQGRRDEFFPPAFGKYLIDPDPKTRKLALHIKEDLYRTGQSGAVTGTPPFEEIFSLLASRDYDTLLERAKAAGFGASTQTDSGEKIDYNWKHAFEVAMQFAAVDDEEFHRTALRLLESKIPAEVAIGERVLFRMAYGYGLKKHEALWIDAARKTQNPQIALDIAHRLGGRSYSRKPRSPLLDSWLQEIRRGPPGPLQDWVHKEMDADPGRTGCTAVLRGAVEALAKTLR